MEHEHGWGGRGTWGDWSPIQSQPPTSTQISVCMYLLCCAGNMAASPSPVEKGDNDDGFGRSLTNRQRGCVARLRHAVTVDCERHVMGWWPSRAGFSRLLIRRQAGQGRAGLSLTHDGAPSTPYIRRGILRSMPRLGLAQEISDCRVTLRTPDTPAGRYAPVEKTKKKK